MAIHDLRRAFTRAIPAAHDHPSHGTWRPHDFLTYQQAAEEFHVQVRYLRTLHEKRRVRSYRISKRVLFRWIDLHDFFESCAINPIRPSFSARRAVGGRR